MAGYVVRRVLQMFLLMFLLSIVVFFLFNLLPGDPARLTCGKACTPEIIEANRHRLGLDEPPLTQYVKFVSAIFVGRTFSPDSPAPIICDAPCLGYSFNRHEQVMTLITQAAPVTFWLAIGAFILWITAGISLGIFAALNHGRWPDRLVMTISLIGYSLPAFFLGLLLIFFVIIKWQMLPFPAYVSPFDNPVQFLQTMILPWIVLATLNTAFYMRLTRNQVLETFGDDYVRTARAKGLPERTVVVKHALRAGLTPIVTAAGLDLAVLLGGAIISENIFSLPGLGALAVNSVTDSDLPLIAGITLVTASIIIVANLVVDLLYAVVDPRVRLG
jgi:peptide/nickel transport system permease protein